MSYVTAVLVLLTGLIVAVWNGINGRRRRQQQQKNEQWNRQLEALMEAYKKFKKK
jgi:hypothetical protein